MVMTFYDLHLLLFWSSEKRRTHDLMRSGAGRGKIRKSGGRPAASEGQMQEQIDTLLISTLHYVCDLSSGKCCRQRKASKQMRIELIHG